MSMGSLVGQIVGAFLVSYPMEIYGRKKTFAVCLILTAILTFMQFFATTIGVLTASQYLSGIVWVVTALLRPPMPPRSSHLVYEAS